MSYINAQTATDQASYAQRFVLNFDQYIIDIQVAGIARIPTATLSKQNVLSVAYTYRSEGEDRSGNMELFLDEKSDQFVGNWKTVAENGNVYQGRLYLVFEESGEASGSYQFLGASYKINILIPSK